MKIPALWFAAILTVAVLGTAGCAPSGTDHADRNAQFIADLPADVDPSAQRLFRVLIERGNSKPLNRFNGQFYGLVRTLYEAAGKSTETVVAMEAWRYYEVLAIDVLPEVRWPTRAQYAMNWKDGYVVVPRIHPAPTSMDYISNLPPGTSLVLEMVPIKTAAGRKYQMNVRPNQSGD